MNTEPDAAHVAADVVTEHVEKDATQEVARDFEKDAREKGWVPESEYKGEHRPAVFLDAEAYLKRHDEVSPFIHRENKKLRKELDALKKDVDARVSKLVNVSRSNYEREMTNYEREIARLKGEQEKAVEAGDVPAFKRLDKEIGNVPVPEEVEGLATEGAATVDGNDIVAKFQESNPWYKTNKLLTAYAERLSDKIAKDTDDKLPLAENLQMVEAKMRAEYPEQYAKKATNGHANVDGGSDFNGAGKSDPMLKYGNAERSQCAADMKQFPTVFKTKADWIAKYEGKK